MKTQLELIVFHRLSDSVLGVPECEYKFHPTRKWKFDFAYPKIKLAIEAEGGVWSYGRHCRGQGFINDTTKYNEAVKLGWRVLRYTGDTVCNIRDDMAVFAEESVDKKK